MAAPGHGLGAHHREPPPLLRRHQLLERRRELGRLHVVGVAAEGLVAPGGVGRIRAWLAQSAQLLDVPVGDPVTRQLGAQ